MPARTNVSIKILKRQAKLLSRNSAKTYMQALDEAAANAGLNNYRFATKKHPDEAIKVCQDKADPITQLLSTLAYKAQGNNVFADRAQMLVLGVLTVLTELRDKHGEAFTVETVVESLTIDAMDKFVEDPRLSETAKKSLIGALGCINYATPSKRKDLGPIQNDFSVTALGYAKSYAEQERCHPIDLTASLFEFDDALNCTIETTPEGRQYIGRLVNGQIVNGKIVNGQMTRMRELASAVKFPTGA